ncbi:AAA family ATPase [Pseudochrobactrum sp. sp1633]|uniref:AAA family ATPase n=1 Tax=Pseudochrobactrum sp. sp1633 TaxID=3036706 RepID=UPI0025A68110|nr:AAA family ATPase [Pseudochrobactrum sp. sp1633]MDM8344871.1 AAA family ATPase [Pseudochrobactrum sp. sp1633]HWD14704.1 AAA family ATPase [Pseudochrobactrum sp.]
MENSVTSTEMHQDSSTDMRNIRPLPRLNIDAFCETEAGLSVLQACSQDRRLTRTRWQIRSGGIDRALEAYQSTSTPHLIIFESAAGQEQLLQDIMRLAEVCDSGTRVLIIGRSNEVRLYRELIRNGVSDYLVSPASLPEVISVLDTLFTDPSTAPSGRSIAVIGAKGGVGSSTLAHNISWSLANQFKHEVVLADMDLPFGTVNINFDQDPTLGIADAVYAPERVDEVYLDRLLAESSEHLSLLAAPSTLEKTYDFESESFVSIIDAALRTTQLLVLDMPHSWNSWVRTTLMRADEVIIVATPDLASLRNTKNLLDTLILLRPNDRPAHLILNQTGVAKRPEISATDFCTPLNIKPLAVIEHDPQLFGTAANNAHMLGEADQNHKISQKITDIARELLGKHDVPDQAKKAKPLAGLLSKLKRKKSA